MPRPRREHLLRAAALALLGLLLASPTLLGVQRCTFARVFHAPCPGCGMTRAARLMLAGDWRGSLYLHPLLVPVGLGWAFFVAAAFAATLARGWPVVHETRSGRAAIAVLVLVYAATVGLWALRAVGLFGGPVPVD